MTKVLVVDDEPKIASVLSAYLEREGYQVLTASDGIKALENVRRDKPDLVLLDVMLPGMDGWQVCRNIRGESSVPIIMLTARVEETDRIVGLELGADDYVTKPFSPREVVARVKAVLRRMNRQDEQERIVVGPLVVDTGGHRAFCHSKALDLTPTEFDLLKALSRHPGRTYTRAQLLDLVQGVSAESYERSIDSHVKNLRRKLENAGCPSAIATVFGVGYRLEETKGG